MLLNQSCTSEPPEELLFSPTHTCLASLLEILILGVAGTGTKICFITGDTDFHPQFPPQELDIALPHRELLRGAGAERRTRRPPGARRLRWGVGAPGRARGSDTTKQRRCRSVVFCSGFSGTEMKEGVGKSFPEETFRS